MGMTPQQFLESFVDPNLCDCESQPGDVRRAFNAAVSASHLADHYFKYHHRHNPHVVQGFSDLGSFIANLDLATGGAFKDIRSIANAYKHLYTGDGRLAKFSSVDSCGSIECIEFESDCGLSIIQEELIEFGEGPAPSRVMFSRKDGSRGEYLPTLRTAVEHLRDLVYKNA